MKEIPSNLPSSQPTRRERFFAFPLVRVVCATLSVALPVAVILVLAHQIPDKSMRVVWPQLLAAVAVVAAYRWFVNRVETRTLRELSTTGAGREFTSGVVIGAVALSVVMCMLGIMGAYQVQGVNDSTALVKPLAELALVAVFEEILFRGIIFRITEQSWGSGIALVLSSVVFALAHLPNENVTLIGVGVTFVAGVMLGAAYMLTRRLWLPIGIHFIWNYLLDAVFSVAASGHPSKGVLQAQLVGPDWLTGAAYGIEASLVTLVVLVVTSIGLLVGTRQRNLRLGPALS